MRDILHNKLQRQNKKKKKITNLMKLVKKIKGFKFEF